MAVMVNGSSRCTIRLGQLRKFATKILTRNNQKVTNDGERSRARRESERTSS